MPNNKINKICAYCGESNLLTKEHIWPGCILKRTPHMNARYYGKNEKFFRGELTIKDVCDICNNGALSQLDAYICKLYDIYLLRIVKANKSFIFKYDYNKLLRWLLKISYNTARSNDSDKKELCVYSDYIINGGEPPSTISLRIELIKPSKNPNYIKGSGKNKFIEPQSTRCCRIETEAGKVPGVTIRLVAINSFYFWLVITQKDTTLSDVQQFVIDYLPNLELNNKKQVTLRARGRSMLEMHADWIMNPNARISHRELVAKNG